MATEHADKPIHWRARYHLARLLGWLICEPQLRIGRWRHDGDCDGCGAPATPYAFDRLTFPIEDLSADATTKWQKLRAMFGASYVRVCTECAAALEDDRGSADPNVLLALAGIVLLTAGGLAMGVGLLVSLFVAMVSMGIWAAIVLRNDPWGDPGGY